MFSAGLPARETIETVIVAGVGLVACVLTLFNAVIALRHRGTSERQRRWWLKLPEHNAPRVPTSSEIETRVSQLAASGALPPGWSGQDATRLVRIRAREHR